jgi:hypothetical protein
MTLYELTLEAYKQIERYNHPDIDLWCNEMDKILQVLDLPLIENDRVIRIIFDTDNEDDCDYLYIHTEYAVMGHTTENSVGIPIHILKADDPIATARSWFYNEALNTATYEVRRLQYQLTEQTQLMEKLQKMCDQLGDKHE